MSPKTLREKMVVRISLGMLFTLGTGLITLVGWLVALQASAANTAKDVDKMKSQDEIREEKYVQAIINIDQRLSRIEGRLER